MMGTKKPKELTKIQRYTAFTLVEVLITLSIIGIVAAMTVPTLLNNTQKQGYVTGLKKAYSQGNQVLEQMASDNDTPGDLSSIFNGDTAAVGTRFASYYKVIKTCGTANTGECFAKFDNNFDGSANSTSSWTNTVNGKYAFITAEGMSFAFNSYYSQCGTDLSFASDVPTEKTCGFIYIDINGLKKPNNFGRDVFIFFITSNKALLLYPQAGFYVSGDGTTGSMADGGNYYWNYQGRNGCSKNNKGGTDCTGRIMENNWVMDY